MEKNYFSTADNTEIENCCEMVIFGYVTAKRLLKWIDTGNNANTISPAIHPPNPAAYTAFNGRTSVTKEDIKSIIDQF